MANAQLNLHQAAFLVRLRQFPDETARKAMKADLFRLVKDTFGIPQDHKLKVEVDAASSPDFLVLYRKTDGQPYQLHADGKWIGAERSTAAVPAPVDTRKWYRTPGILRDFVADSMQDTYYADDPMLLVEDDKLSELNTKTADFVVEGDVAYIKLDPSDF